MIYNRSGAQFDYRDITYTIGGKVYAIDESVYAGLYGVIREIRTGEDLETDHDTPDIYCEFMPPVLPDEIKAFETHFAHLYGTEKRLDDVGIDMVIMAPDMLVVLDPQKDAQSLEIFLVREDWAIDDDYGTSTQIVADYHMAKFHFNNLVFQEMIDGCIQKWANRQDLETDTRKDFYECWLHDEYYENHYKVTIERTELTLPALLLQRFGSYWESVSECAHSLLREFLLQISKPECYVPEKDNVYPLSEGNGTDSCGDCCVYKDYDKGNGQD